ncbi:hypothetical protein FRC08_015569 [Ceratobasidium sp. 394]|nr:hypothetical protein FRC08_015569 [Ceratobasidium sp. 394]
MRYHRSLALALLLPLCAARIARRATWCTAKDKCWPSPSTWSSFNNSIGGRLVAPRPPAWPCHDPNYDEAACAEVKANWNDSFWRASQVGAMEGLVWESPGCDIDTPRNVTCEQGLVPTYSVAAVGADDISKAIKFASKHNVKLVVKNTGHDYLGRSSGAGSLSIWTHQLKDINFTNSFVPSGCSGNGTGVPAVTLGAGTQWLNVYEAANEHNVVVVGGGARSVGAAGGWLQGGGHSPLGGLHGMGVDNVLQFTVVKANGDVVVANSCQNKELFWAMRGGGGSTWGIALGVTYRTHPPPSSIIGISLGVNTTSPDQMAQFSKVLLRSIPSIMDSGLRGYATWSNAFFGGVFIHPNSPSISTSNATLQPLWDWVSNNTGATMDLTGTSHPTFLDWFNTYIAQDVSIAMSVWVGSRLVSREALLSKTDELVTLSAGKPGLVGCNINMIGGGAINKPDPESTGLNPQWRKDALISWTYGSGWPDDTPPETIDKIKRSITELTQAVGKVGGLENAGYFNEADPDEPNWKQAWFGSHYKRLLKIKKKVDSKGLFSCNRCIGSKD